MRHQGKTSATKLHKSRDDVCIETGNSGETVRRYIGLTYLIPELLNVKRERYEKSYLFKIQ